MKDEEIKELTEEERKELKKQIDELSDEELDKVAGAGLLDPIWNIAKPVIHKLTDEMTDEELDKIAGGAMSSGEVLENVTVTAFSFERYQGGMTANGTKIARSHIGKICAVSGDLRSKIPYGSKIKVSGYSGELEVIDCCGNYISNRVDILLESEADCNKWGKKTCSITKL